MTINLQKSRSSSIIKIFFRMVIYLLCLKNSARRVKCLQISKTSFTLYFKVLFYEQSGTKSRNVTRHKADDGAQQSLYQPKRMERNGCWRLCSDRRRNRP